MTEAVNAMRAKLDADETYSRATVPAGCGQRDRDDAAYALRRLGLDLLVVSRIPRLLDWFEARQDERAR